MAYQERATGLGPATSSLGSCKSSIPSGSTQGLTATPSPACTTACTSEAEKANADPLDGDQPTIAGAEPADTDLAAIVSAWSGLPTAIRAGIVAMVKATGNAGDQQGHAAGKKPQARSKAKGTTISR